MGLLSDNMDWGLLGASILANNSGHGGQLMPALGAAYGDYSQAQSAYQKQLQAQELQKMQMEQARMQMEQQKSLDEWAKNQGVPYEVALAQIKNQGPSDVQSFKYLKSLSPEDRSLWMQNKRAPSLWDRGDMQGYYNPVTMSPVPTMVNQLKPGDTPENRYNQASATAQGKAEGEAISAAPGYIQKANTLISAIDELSNHPGLPRITGPMGMLPSYPGSDASNAQVRLNQVKGKVFMEAYEGLKGGGQITEIEGAKAEAAKARLDQAQSYREYKIALNDLKREVTALVELANKRMGYAISNSPSNSANQPLSKEEWIKQGRPGN